MTTQARMIMMGTEFVQDARRWKCIESYAVGDEIKVLARLMHHAGYIISEFVYKYDQSVYLAERNF